MTDLSALAARLDKMLGTYADSMPKEAYFEVDAVMRALLQAPPAQREAEPVAVPAVVPPVDDLGRRIAEYQESLRSIGRTVEVPVVAMADCARPGADLERAARWREKVDAFVGEAALNQLRKEFEREETSRV